MITAFYSDPHFGHDNIINFCDRPFKDVDDMDTQLIDNYNELIKEDDTVLWLGDCFFGSTDYAKDIMYELHGNKILVCGPIEDRITRMLKIGFSVVLHFCYVNVAEQTCLARHYPYPGTKHRDGRNVDDYVDTHLNPIKSQILLHGHTHTNIKRLGNQIHVGVDAWDYKPALLTDVEDLVKELRPSKESAVGY